MCSAPLLSCSEVLGSSTQLHEGLNHLSSSFPLLGSYVPLMPHEMDLF